MVSSLEELIQKRNHYIEAQDENGFTEGIHALLTDLYPDSAHFIYELLQNAEDMFATKVQFLLQDDGVWFQHNGTKRPFNLADIDAITNIKNNGQKQDDPTTIGKFGVGFKSVFAYTSTPEIHSGEYHFRIKDYFVPEIEGVSVVEMLDADGTQWTKFWLPFNHEKKTAEMAFQETLSGLEQLNVTSILFLRHIKRIEYVISNQSIGFAERIEEKQPNHVTIKYHNPKHEKIENSTWLQFVEPIEMIDDQGNNKQMAISIAFALEKGENQKEKIVPIEGGGRTFIYFPAEKEYSGLRFHINALFASTVARDSVRACDENNVLIQKIADLLKKSIGEIKELGLISNSFFECLPNKHDDLNPFYQILLDATCQAFTENEYLPAKEGGFISSLDAVMGPKALSDLWTDHAIATVFEKSKRWITNAPQKNSRLDYFFKTLDIEEFSYEQFANRFVKTDAFQLEEYICAQDKIWLKRFFSNCETVIQQIGVSRSIFSISQDDYIGFIKGLKIIPSLNNQFGEARRLYFLPSNLSIIIDSEIMFVNPTFFQSDDHILFFLRDTLSIKEYGEMDIIRKILSRYSKEGLQPDEAYFKNMLFFARYQREHDDITFGDYELFITKVTEKNKYLKELVVRESALRQKYEELGLGFMGSSINGKQISNNLYITKGRQIIFDKHYDFSVGEQILSVYKRYLLWDEYAKHYNNDELQLFKKFAVSCGAMDRLQIVESSVYKHPDKTIHNQPGNETRNSIKIDFTINHIVELLNLKSTDINREIGNTLYSAGANASKYAKAQYRTNKRYPTNERDSSLIYYLRKYERIPDRQGILHTPGSLTISEIHPEFVYDPNNALFQALQFGSDADTEKKELEKLNIAAESLGKYVVDENEYKEFQEYQEKKKKTKVNKELFSPNELFEKQNRKQRYDSTDEEDFSSDGVVGNKTRRERNIISSFQDLENQPSPERRIFSQISESNAGEKQMLSAWYNGKCQMCETKIRKYDGNYHFIARNIIHTKDLPDNIRNTSDICWNSLCLCPNCAARYEYCSKSLSGLFDQILQTEVIERDRERIILTIELDGSKQEIHYVPKHFLALQTVVKLIHNRSNDSDSQLSNVDYTVRRITP